MRLGTEEPFCPLVRTLLCGLLSTAWILGCSSPMEKSSRRLKGHGAAPAEADAKAAQDQEGEESSRETDGLSSRQNLPALALAPETLAWKRYRAFEDGLSQGLQIDKGQLCLELGQYACVDKVHLTVLGGNEPYTMGQYESARTPTVLTGVAVDRIVLAACNTRLTLDKALGAQAVVFKSFPLTGPDVTTEQANSQTTILYRSLLSRDATLEELSLAQGVLEMSKAPEKVALALCFIVGSQAENIFM